MDVADEKLAPEPKVEPEIDALVPEQYARVDISQPAKGPNGTNGQTEIARNPRKKRFHSSAMDLEYAVLTRITRDDPQAMINGSSGYLDSVTMSSTPSLQSTQNYSLGYPVDSIVDALPIARATSNYSGTPTPPKLSSPVQTYSLFAHLQREAGQKASPATSSSWNDALYNLYPQWDPQINQYFLGPLPGLPENKPFLCYPDILGAIELHANENKSMSLSFSIGVYSEDTAHRYGNHESGEWGLRYKEPEEIYSQVRRPFSYTVGFHLLVIYLRRRFHDDKYVLVKMAKSMAEYRPSFTAQVMSLKEDDLIFMEQCFQRTLLEYDKYLAISGTPTVIWRRTGQISYVSQEFAMLTGWTSEMLLMKITFIVELMDDASVIKYFELFSKIAYGDHRGVVTTDCDLMNPTRDKRIKTRTVWTLKRDVFGIPMMIIGNFLPVI